MPQITQIAVISLILIATVFFLVGFLCFRVSRLTEENSTAGYGTLVGFRRYYVTDQKGDHSLEYDENKAGRVPVVRINIDGEQVDISAAAANYSLTKEDIGKQVRVRYRRLIGITMIIDDAKSLRNYNQLQNALFWTFISVAIIVFILGVLANAYLPGMLEIMLS